MNSLKSAVIIATVFLIQSFFTVQAQEKEIAKVDAYIVKAKQATDPAKKAGFYSKAAEVIMTARLPKSENVKIGDAYLEDGDITNAVKYFMRCDKEDKNEGYVKVGHKMIEQAFNDPKTEGKTITKAISYFEKGGKKPEGFEAAGDAYYNKGEEFYMKAADYYAQGKMSAKIDKIAGEFAAAGNKPRAAEVYMKLNTEEGFQKAGDLYYSLGDYNNAFTAYDKGGIADGIRKYADKLYGEGETADANALYGRAVELYAAKQNTSAIGELAKMEEDRGEFGIAASFYEKSGEANKAIRAKAYNNLVSFEFAEAELNFGQLGDNEIIKAINANMKYLTPLKEAAYYFDEVKQNEPPVTYSEDPETKKKTPNSADVEVFNDYYKGSIEAIVDNCYIVSANVPKLAHAGMRDAFMKKFKQYGAIRKVLDANFGKKLDKTTVTAKDVVM